MQNQQRHELRNEVLLSWADRLPVCRLASSKAQNYVKKRLYKMLFESARLFVHPEPKKENFFTISEEKVFNYRVFPLINSLF